MFTKHTLSLMVSAELVRHRPHKIVLTPAFTVALEGEVGIVGHESPS